MCRHTFTLHSDRTNVRLDLEWRSQVEIRNVVAFADAISIEKLHMSRRFCYGPVPKFCRYDFAIQPNRTKRCKAALERFGVNGVEDSSEERGREKNFRDFVAMDEICYRPGIEDDVIRNDLDAGAAKKRTQEFPNKEDIACYAIVLIVIADAVSGRVGVDGASMRHRNAFGCAGAPRRE